MASAYKERKVWGIHLRSTSRTRAIEFAMLHLRQALGAEWCLKLFMLHLGQLDFGQGLDMWKLHLQAASTKLETHERQLEMTPKIGSKVLQDGVHRFPISGLVAMVLDRCFVLG